MSDLDYKISLEQNNNVYGGETSHVPGQISPDKTLSQKFSYRIPSNIQTGDYKFRVHFFSQSGMCGFDVLKRIKNIPQVKDMPIIVLTNINPDVQDLMKNWGGSHIFF